MKKRICAPQICGSALLLASVLLLSSTFGLAQNPSRTTESQAAAHMRGLNTSLLRLHGQMQQAGANDVRLLRSQVATVIAQRAAALSKLIQSNPHQALSFAFSPELLADLSSKFPNSAASLESHTTVSGPVEHWIVDNDDKTSRSLFHMNAGGRVLNLYFAGPEPDLKTGDAVQATGVVVGSEMAVSASNTVQSSAAPTRWPTFAFFVLSALLSVPAVGANTRHTRERTLAILKQFAIYGLVFAVFVFGSTPIYAQNSCSNTGVQNVGVLLVTFPGVTPPSNITPQNVYDMFFSATGPSLDGYWREASYGQTSATGNVFGWYTLDSSYANCLALDSLRDAAIAAAANAGVSIQNYNRIFIVITDFGCGWTGVAGGLCKTLSSPNGSFVASTSYLDASWQRSQIEGAGNAAHEGGHNFGLGHAQLRTFATEPLGPLGTTGTLTEYGDPFSDMSCSNIGHYAAPHKAEMLGWMAAANYQTVQTGGTYTIAPSELSSAGPQALKIQRGTGNAGYYLWVEYRQVIGYDSLFTFLLPAGALIHYEDSTTGSHTQLLNFPSDTALMPGASWSDPYSDLSLSIISATPTGLAVNVNYSGSVPCTHANPGVSITPLDPSTYPGVGAGYTATITNNDSAGCSASTFMPSSNQPAGWAPTFSANSITLSPGQSGSLTMTQTPPAGTAPGTYPVATSASNFSYVGSATGNLTVVSAPSLSVTAYVPSSSYTRKNTVPITATVLSGGTPASAANVTFTLTTASGKTVTQSATAASRGTVTWNYKLGPNAPTGTYSVSAQASVSSTTGAAATQSAISNSVNFTVQ